MGWLRRAIYRMRTEGEGREAAAIGIGIFIGCSPLFGLHLPLVYVVGALLRLNRLKMYIAANVSNPLSAPLIILAELQTGAWLRRQELHSLSLDAVRGMDPWTFGLDILAGSVVVGTLLGIGGWLATRATASTNAADADFDGIVRAAADRYLLASMTAWEFARGKLRGDPIYRATICDGLLPDGRALIDVGCGTGLMLALVDEAARAMDEARWSPDRRPPPRFDQLIGIELRPRVAATAARVLEGAATILAEDVRHARLPGASTILAFDVLHMLPKIDQETIVASLAATLEPGGVLLLREADAGGGWRFALVRIGNALKAIVTFNWRQRFHFRTASGWQHLLESHGLDVRVQPMREGTPFANVLIRASRPSEREAARPYGERSEPPTASVSTRRS